jgi:hypothetical protein
MRAHRECKSTSKSSHSSSQSTEGSTGAFKNNSVYMGGLARQLIIFTLLFLSLWKKQEVVCLGIAPVAMGEMQCGVREECNTLRNNMRLKFI